MKAAVLISSRGSAEMLTLSGWAGAADAAPAAKARMKAGTKAKSVRMRSPVYCCEARPWRIICRVPGQGHGAGRSHAWNTAHQHLPATCRSPHVRRALGLQEGAYAPLHEIPDCACPLRGARRLRP